MLRRKFMFKKLLVFALAFGMGLTSFQISKQKIKPLDVEGVSNTTISNKPVSSAPDFKPSQDSISLFEECVRKFKKAVAENDQETVASVINFPIFVGLPDENDSPSFKEIKNSDEFIANYDKIFNDSFKRCISQMELDRMDYRSRHEAFNYSSIRIDRSIYSFGIKMGGYKINDKDFGVKITNLSRSFITYSKNGATSKTY